jgi:hypothetical protein
MTDIRVTQVGAEAWLADNPALCVTQVGAEAWVAANPALRVTQVGAEVWYVISSPAGGPRRMLAQIL